MDLPNRPPSVNIQVRINDAQSNNKSLRTREMDMQYTPYKPLLKRLRAIVPAYLGAQDCDIRYLRDGQPIRETDTLRSLEWASEEDFLDIIIVRYN